MSAVAEAEHLVKAYAEAWNRHDVGAILAFHAPDMVFTNHMAGMSAEGSAVNDLLTTFFARWPDFRSTVRRQYVTRDLAVVEWSATATHLAAIEYDGRVAEPSGRAITGAGVDVMPLENGFVKRKDVYSDYFAILRQVGLVS